MSNTENNAIEDLTKINGKSVDAIGHVVFKMDFDHFKSPFCVQKVFGLVDKKTNGVFKFKLIVNEDGPGGIKIKLIYVSEETIACKIKIQHYPLEILEHLTISDELTTFNLNKKNIKPYNRVYFSISVLVITSNSMNNVFAEKFNNPSTSDFRVDCLDKQFYVHQRILRRRSEYFEAVLGNDCIEKRDKILKIDDFPPKVVEIFLGYLYNNALPIAGTTLEDRFQLLRIADKYNAKELLDAIDTFTSQEFQFVLKRTDNVKKLPLLERYLKRFEKIQSPKFITMIYEWRRTEKGCNGLDNTQWSSLIRKNPNFAMLSGLTSGRTDYQSWVKQHISWSLGCTMSPGGNDFAVLVGPIGEMKGAVKCTLI